MWKYCGFLTSSGNNIFYGPYVQELLNVILLPVTLAIIKIQRNSQLDSLEIREITLMIFLLEMLFFKGPITAKTSVMVQRIIPNDNLEKPNN